MHKILLSPSQEQGENPAYVFYREGVGFGTIESVPVGENGGNTALVTFSDELSPDDPALLSLDLSDISVYEDGEFCPQPVADLEKPENVLHFIGLGINAIVSARRQKVAAEIQEQYGDRIRKPRIKRAFERRLSSVLSGDARYEYSPVKRPTGF